MTSDPIIIIDNESLELYASSGTGTSEDPYIISNKEIIVSNGQHGIKIDGTTKHFEIRENYISTGNFNDVFGIYIINVENGTAIISNNQLENNNIGIKIDSAPYAQVIENSISNSNRFGILIQDGSENSKVELNIINSALESGINVEGRESSILSNQIKNTFNEYSDITIGIGIHRDGVTVLGNTVEGFWEGINLSPVSGAFVLYNIVDNCASGITGWPSDSQIAYNILSNGYFDGNGIRLQGEFSNWNSDDNLISFNRIENYPSYGLQLLENSNNNLITNNAFVNNNIESTESQSKDDASENEIIHNYWDEWVSPDENEDGIVDNPYAITGSSNNADNLPLVMNLVVNPLAETEVSKPLSFLEPLNSPWVIVPSLLLLIGIPFTSFVKSLSTTKLNKLSTKTLTGMIGFAPATLMAIFSSDADQSDLELIPPELTNYKFLLNPIRLSIIKMLHTHYSYPAYMLRESLQISWGKFSSHVSALIEKGYISTQEGFYEGSPKRILRIELFGINSYMELREILLQLFDGAA